MNKPESPLYALSFGYSLAMRVMQSDLYPSLDGAERAECDELIARGQSAVPSEQPIAEQPQAEQPDSVYLGSAGPSEDLQTALPLDPAGVPKLPLTALESLAIDACNRVKAWAESDRAAPFPEDAHMLADGVLMLAAQRRKGVQ